MAEALSIINKITGKLSLCERIATRNKPVLLYGMGNGAELTSAYLASKGIEISGVFASDGFVRGQEFMGSRVMSVREAEERHGDFTAVLSFALENEKRSVAYEFAKRHFLVCPSITPYGGALDVDFIKENANRFAWLHEKLSDQSSRENLERLLLFAVTGSLEYTHPLPFTPPAGYVSHSGTHVDIGAYDGTTAREYIKMNRLCKSVTAFEPDRISYEKLCASTVGLNVNCINAAVDSRDGTASFSSKGSRGSSLGEGDDVKTVSLDRFFGCMKTGDTCDVGSIRIDGEGADQAILDGGVNLIYNCRPAVCAAVYHKAEDILTIPKWLDYQLGGCKLFLEAKPYIPAFDVFIYATK